MGHLLGYARVSTTDQQPQLQVDALERFSKPLADLVARDASEGDTRLLVTPNRSDCQAQ